MPQTIDNMSAIWSNSLTTYTFLKTNITGPGGGAEQSAAGSLLMDLQVGGSSRFSVNKTGSIFAATTQNTEQILLATGSASTNASIRWRTGNRLVFSNGNNAAYISIESMDLRLAGANRIISSSGAVRFTDYNDTAYSEIQAASLTFTTDLFLTRRGTANLRLGLADAAAPVAQTLSVQSVVAGTTNTAGANLTITGSQGTGTGAGGSIVFQVAPAGSSGTAQNALATALTIGGDGVSTFGARIVVPQNLTGGAISFGTSGCFLGHTLGSNTIIVSNGVTSSQFNGGTFVAGSTGGFVFSDNPNAWVGNTDVFLRRDAANTLALRNGTSPQTFRVYNTTDGTNSEFASLYWAGNAAYLLSGGTGTGPSRPLVVGTAANNANLTFWTNGTPRWSINGADGSLLASTDNAYDIGTTSNYRPRNIFAAGYIRAAGANGFWAGSTSFIFWDARTQMSAPASNVLRVDDPSSNAAIIQTRQFTVSNLPSAATYPGSMAFVSDATATTARSTVAGGGSNKVMVMSDGTNWLIVA